MDAAHLIPQRPALGSLEGVEEALFFAPDHERPLLVADEYLRTRALERAARERDTEGLVARQRMKLRTLNGHASANIFAPSTPMPPYPTLERVRHPQSYIAET